MTETVTIPRAEYDQLRQAAENVADLAAYDRGMKDEGSQCADD